MVRSRPTSWTEVCSARSRASSSIAVTRTVLVAVSVAMTVTVPVGDPDAQVDRLAGVEHVVGHDVSLVLAGRMVLGSCVLSPRPGGRCAVGGRPGGCRRWRVGACRRRRVSGWRDGRGGGRRLRAARRAWRASRWSAAALAQGAAAVVQLAVERGSGVVGRHGSPRFGQGGTRRHRAAPPDEQGRGGRGLSPGVAGQPGLSPGVAGQPGLSPGVAGQPGLSPGRKPVSRRPGRPGSGAGPSSARVTARTSHELTEIPARPAAASARALTDSRQSQRDPGRAGVVAAQVRRRLLRRLGRLRRHGVDRDARLPAVHPHLDRDVSERRGDVSRGGTQRIQHRHPHRRIQCGDQQLRRPASLLAPRPPPPPTDPAEGSRRTGSGP